MAALLRGVCCTLVLLSICAQAPAHAKQAAKTHKALARVRTKVATPRVDDIKSWSNPVYSRVAVYLSGPAKVHSGQLAQTKDAPPRIFVDIQGAVAGNNIQSELNVQDQLLQRVRTAEQSGGGVRVVLDLKKAARPRVVVMENPYRVVIDALAGEDDGQTMEALLEKMPPAQVEHRPRVVIDPGHGGHDSGALGPGRVREKDVVLAIAKNVQQLLDAAGVDAVMTRDADTFVSLEERTAIANRLGADAFVSIHANSAPRKAARGIETYYLNVASDRYALRLAALENKTSEKQASDLQLILADLSTKANSQESVGLASRVQQKMVRYARPLNAKTRDLGVKASLFYVLLGARMPSILVETSFISNAQEAKLLGSPAYQRKLAKAIAEAVTEHLKVPLRVVGQ